MLKQGVVFSQIKRTYDGVMKWVQDNDGFLRSAEVGDDLQEMEVRVGKMKEEMGSVEGMVLEVKSCGDKLGRYGVPDLVAIMRVVNELNGAWGEVKLLAVKKEEGLVEARDVRGFFVGADDLIALLNEKGAVFSGWEFGGDFESVTRLIKELEGVEGEVGGLRERVIALGLEADRLCGVYGGCAEGVKGKRVEVVWKLDGLVETVKSRRLELDSYIVNKFTSEYSSLVNWMSDMKEDLRADDLAKLIAGAESLLETHRERKGEIDSREGSFKSINEIGRLLIDRNVIPGSNVDEKLECLSNERVGLMRLLEDRRKLYEKCLELQLLYRDTEEGGTKEQEIRGGGGSETVSQQETQSLPAIKRETLTPDEFVSPEQAQSGAEQSPVDGGSGTVSQQETQSLPAIKRETLTPDDVTGSQQNTQSLQTCNSHGFGIPAQLQSGLVVWGGFVYPEGMSQPGLGNMPVGFPETVDENVDEQLFPVPSGVDDVVMAESLGSQDGGEINQGDGDQDVGSQETEAASSCNATQMSQEGVGGENH